MEESPSRKLTVLVHADVAGSTALVKMDETLAHQRIQDVFQRFSETIKNHNGIPHEIRGDALVAEFSRASDAINASLFFQAANNAHNAKISDELCPVLRIGVSMGEVVVADNTVTGEGVILAQRLEQLAEPGFVSIQGAVYETIPRRLPFNYESLGEQELKGFDEPVKAYTVSLKPGVELPASESSIEEAGIHLELPDKPSIAVLPFTNMSDDPEQEFFSDGIAEDIITSLSKIDNLLVVSRISSFTYKDQAIDLKQVSREQGVRYVLEGSVRKSADQVRVNAQLIDATTGLHRWAERYDRKLEDIFDVQDEITREVVVALDVELGGGERVFTWSRGTQNLKAWECVRKGMHVMSELELENLYTAERLYERALKLDPNYAIAWSGLGWVQQIGDTMRLGQDSEEKRRSTINKAREFGKKALDVDPTCEDAYCLMSMLHLEDANYELAVEMSEKAIALAPGHAGILAAAANVLNKSGQPDRALELMKKAMRWCPIHPAWFILHLGTSYRLTGQLDAAIVAYEKASQRATNWLSPHVNLASTLGEANRLEDARKSVSEIRRLDPNFSTNRYLAGVSYKHANELVRIKDGLNKVGLPD